MTREEALKILRGTHDKALFSVRNALETLIPELTESEDKRITRAINNMLPFIPDEAYANNGVTKEDVLAWLEKQKECVADSSKTSAGEDERIRRVMLEHFKSKTKETWCGLPVVDIIAYLEKQKGLTIENNMISSKKCNKSPLTDEAFKEQLERVLRNNVLDTDIRITGDTVIGAKQKEQRSADNVSIEEHIKGFKALCDDLSKPSIDSGKQKEQNGGIEECTDFTIYHPLVQVGERKNQGGRVMDNAFERARAAYGTGAYDDATLEFLFPQLKESEDERIKRELTGFIGQALHSGGGVVVSPEKERTWIEWIMGRQEEHWKPSQEQMYILNWVANVLLDENGVVERAAAEKLRVLYNDLKKLK